MGRGLGILLKKIGFYGVLVVLAIVAVFPLFWIALSSFKPEALIFSPHSKLIFDPVLKNYEIMIDSGFLDALMKSLIVTTVSVGLAMVVGTFAGYSLSRFEMKHKESFFFFILTTRMGPPVAFAIPFFIMYTKIGLYDTYYGLILVYILFNLAFAVWISRTFFDDVPPELEEAAMVQGYSRFEAFRKIAVPLASKGLMATTVLCFIFTWNEFFYALTLASTEIRTFPVALTGFVGAPYVEWGPLLAGGTIAALVAVALAIVIRRTLIRGLTFGAVR